MASDTTHLVIFTPSGKRGRFAAGTPVLTAARQLGVDLDSVCGGRGICSRCQITPSFGEFSKHGVVVKPGALSEWNKVEERYKSKRDVPPESQVHRQVVRKRAEARDIILNTSTKLYYVEVDQPDMHEPSGDLERLSKALQEQWEINVVHAGLDVLSYLQKALRKGDWKVTCAVHSGSGLRPPSIMHVWPGYYDGSIYGLAVDLGSTTIAAHLCDLQSAPPR